MIDIILKIYIGINLFFAGYYLADDHRWASTNKQKIICIIWCLLTIGFGVIYVLLNLIWVIISELFNKIDETFQIAFWFQYYLTEKYNNIEINTLEKLNWVAVNYRNKNAIKDRIYRYGLNLINKRNNYTPSEFQIISPFN